MHAVNDQDHLFEREKVVSNEEKSGFGSSFKTPSYVLILPAIFLYFLLVFGLYPLTTQVHIQQVCRDLGEDDCESSNVSAHASTLNLISSFAYSTPSILTCGMYGSIADVYGRKIVMIVPYLGFMFYALAYLYVDSYNPSSYVSILIAGNFVMGLSGGYFTFIMSCMCYASDVTALAPHTRKKVYSVTEATIFVPEVFGPVLTGLWATYYGFFVPLLLGVIISAVTVVYVCFLPESLPQDAPSRLEKVKWSPLQTFTNIMFLFTYKLTPDERECDITPLLHTADDKGMPESVHEAEERGVSVASNTIIQYIQSPLPILCVSFFMYLTTSLNQASVRIVYVIHRFGWNSSVIGIYDGLEGLVVSLSMLFAPFVVQKLLRGKVHIQLVTWIQIGYVCRILHWGLFGLMTSTTGIFSLLPLLLFVGPLSPYIRTVVSNSVPAADQAQAFAAYSALEGMSSLAGPVYSAVYVLLVQKGCAWVIFELMAAAVVVALCIVTYVRCVPSLAVHLPELKVPDVSDTDGTTEDTKCIVGGVTSVDTEAHLLSPLLGTDNYDQHFSDHNVANRVSRASRASRTSADDTTLLFRHLAHVQEEAVSVPATVM